MSQSFKITKNNNFCRVFKLPLQYPEGFLFAGGKPTTFLMIDWFNPVLPISPDTPFDFPKILEGKELDEHRIMLIEFIKGKKYCIPGVQYLVITDYGDALIIKKD